MDNIVVSSDDNIIKNVSEALQTNLEAVPPKDHLKVLMDDF